MATPSKQTKSGSVETGLTEPAATACNAIMTSSKYNILHDVFLILTAVDCGNLTDPANGSVNHTAGTTFKQGGCGVTLMECNLSTLRNAIKGVTCAQTSIPFRNAIKRSCLSTLT